MFEFAKRKRRESIEKDFLSAKSAKRAKKKKILYSFYYVRSSIFRARLTISAASPAVSANAVR